MRLVMAVLCIGLRMLAWGVALVPPRLGYACVRAVAGGVYAIDGPRRRRAMRNVAASFPDRSHDACVAIVRSAYRNLFCIGYEFLISGYRLRPDTLDDVVTFDGLEHLRGIEDGGGTVMLTGHVGNWEVLGLAAGLAGFPLCAVARGVDDAGINGLLLSLRERHGQEIISAKGAVERGRDVLRAGKHLAFTPDQHARRSRIWVPFFGTPNAYIKTPATLVRRHDAPCAVGFCRRVGSGFRFHVTIYPLHRPDHSLPAREDVARLTHAYVRRLEEFVRAHPGDYLWMHKLWRTPVDGEELVREDGTYVRHAAFGSERTPADSDSRAGEPRSPRPAR